MRLLPPLKAVQAFEAASRLESFAAAAEELHLTPSAVSHQIRALEKKLGVTLFHRVHRAVVLTDVGRRYAEAVAEGFEANRIRPWLDEGDQTAPIRIWQGDLDAVVPLWTTSQLVDDLSKGGIDVSMTVVPGGEHTTTAFGFVASYELATEESVAWVLDQVQ